MSPFVAVIDIGSNSVRLVIYRVEGRSIWPIFNEKVLAGLGRDLRTTGLLHPGGCVEALMALRRFRAILDSYQLSALHIVATAAVREARDGPAFVTTIREETGFDVRVLSGMEEAHYAAMGVRCGHADATGIVGDMGGSSLELIHLGDEPGITLPLGPFALGAPKPLDQARGAAIIAETLAPHKARYRSDTFHAVGGAWRALAHIWMQKKMYPLEIIHQFEMPASEGLAIARFVASQSPSSLEKLPGISKRRVENIGYAALVMQGLIEALEFQTICFSAFGLREGLLYEALSPELRREDPLIAGCAALGARFGTNDNLGAALAQWALGAYASAPFEAPPEKLIRAAAKLADMGARLHPDHRADLAADQVLRAPIPGQNHYERVFLAATTFTRYSGKTYNEKPILINHILGGEGLEQATQLGMMFRLGCDLSAKSAPLLNHSKLRFADGALHLSADEGWQNLLLGEQTQKRAKALSSALKMPLRIEN